MSEPVREPVGEPGSGSGPQKVSLWFDLRFSISLLFAVYGAVCLVMGLVSTDGDELRKTGGIALNLWAGVGMLVVSAVFVTWALARPMRAETHARPEDMGVDATAPRSDP